MTKTEMSKDSKEFLKRFTAKHWGNLDKLEKKLPKILKEEYGQVDKELLQSLRRGFADFRAGRVRRMV